MNANIWLPEEPATNGPRVYARDFSRYYTLPAGHGPDDLIVLGDHARYLEWQGPVPSRRRTPGPRGSCSPSRSSATPWQA